MSLRERELRTPCNVIKEAGIKDTGMVIAEGIRTCTIKPDNSVIHP